MNINLSINPTDQYYTLTPDAPGTHTINYGTSVDVAVMNNTDEDITVTGTLNGNVITLQSGQAYNGITCPNGTLYVTTVGEGGVSIGVISY